MSWQQKIIIIEKYKPTTLAVFMCSQKTCKFDSQICVLKCTGSTALTK